jgi:hypothetical protein
VRARGIFKKKTPPAGSVPILLKIRSINDKKPAFPVPGKCRSYALQINKGGYDPGGQDPRNYSSPLNFFPGSALKIRKFTGPV